LAAVLSATAIGTSKHRYRSTSNAELYRDDFELRLADRATIFQHAIVIVHFAVLPAGDH
jgi:hypothetical protein